jgi:hypothetical protein
MAPNPFLCEVKRYISQRLETGCTVVGCSMCMGGAGYKQCVAKGCYGNANYEWPDAAWVQYESNGNICPSYDASKVVISSAPPRNMSAFLAIVVFAVTLLTANIIPRRCQGIGENQR